jgi:hypothetical protein
VLGTGLAAGLPVIVATAQVVTRGWTPLADDALIGVDAHDVLTGNSPLLGPWSSGYSAVVGEPTFHPGPLLFWLLALPDRLPWPEALELTIGLVNLACVIGIVALARRRGGLPLMFTTALAVPVMLASLPAEAFSDIWNPYAPLLPLLLLFYVAWSVGCGEHRLLPLAVLLASFVTQAHLSTLLPAAGALAIGLAALALSKRGELLQPPARTWLALAALVGAICWSAPLIDQATNDPGNMRLIYRAVRSDQEKVGLTTGWHGLVHTVGVPPWWLRPPQFGLQRVIELGKSPDPLALASAILVLAALAGGVVLGLRRRRTDVAVAAAIALAACAGVALVIASTPRSSFVTLSYSIRWVSPIGMWAWLTVGWAAAALFGAQVRRRLPARAGVQPALAGGALAATVLVAAIVAARGDLRREPFDQVRQLNDRLEAALPADRPVELLLSGAPGTGFTALGIQSGVLYGLREDGKRVVVEGQVDYLGSDYGRAGVHDPLPVRLDVGTRPPPGARVIASVPYTEYPQQGTLAPQTTRTWRVTVSAPAQP